VDSAIGDISEEKETEEVCYSDPKYWRMNNFMYPDQTKTETAFTDDEFCLLIALFELPLEMTCSLS
jgi:hypothetical protein